jgi:hypothetical protein
MLLTAGDQLAAEARAPQMWVDDWLRLDRAFVAFGWLEVLPLCSAA